MQPDDLAARLAEAFAAGGWPSEADALAELDRIANATELSVLTESRLLAWTKLWPNERVRAGASAVLSSIQQRRAAPAATPVPAPLAKHDAPPEPKRAKRSKKASQPVPKALPNDLDQPITNLASDVANDVKGFDPMATGSFVSYLRVSTARQGASGLGLEAQRTAVADFLNGGRWSLVREFVEVESGKRDDRPKLAEAMALCRLLGAVLVIAKLDRLSRDAHFLLGLQKAGVRFVAADMPEANEMVVGIMAVVAQAERKMISVRTKAALAAAKARGTKLGGDRGNFASIADQGRATGVVSRQAKATARAADLGPTIAALQAEGVTTKAGLAAALTERGIPTARGSSTWSPMQVSRVLARTGM